MAEERAKRKLSAILSADVKGYSRLMGEDELATIETLKNYREIMTALIDKFQGRVVDSPGDNVLAEFSSVVDALECSVEIQKKLKQKNEQLPENRRMEFRIGVNLGDVVEDGERIYGDGVNIAARVESLAEGGGICISGTAFDQVGKKLPLGFEYLGKQTVKNIETPVRVYRVLMEPEAVGRVIGQERPRPRPWRYVVMAAVVAIVLVAAALTVWNFYFRAPRIEPASVKRMAFPLPEKPSIAVLPFENLSGDPDQEYIADGIMENIITGLSQIPEMFVIARTSAFSYKGKPVKIRQVSEELGVRYVLEGSVQRAGDRLRITAQLIDATGGNHLWAERYDRELKDLFALQDEITMKILTALEVKLTRGELARRYSTENFEAWGYFVRGLRLFERQTKEDNSKARKLFEQAVKLDPDYVSPWGMLGYTHVIEVLLGWSESPGESIKRSLEFAQKALALDEAHPQAHTLLSRLYFIQGQYDKSIAEGGRAIALDPNYASGYVLLAMTFHYAGRPEEAIAHVKKAMRLSPYYPAWWLVQLAGPYEMVGRYEEAIATWKQLLARCLKGEFPPIIAHERLALNYARLDRMGEARAHAAEILKIKPDYTVEFYRKTTPYKDRAYLESLIGLLRKAGLPEHPPLPLPDKPSIAVLPFTNMSDDPKQEYFSDGLTEEIITALSRIPKLFVIARNSSFAYKEKAVNIQKVSRELGVKYVLEGSVRRSENQLRITAQLIDATTGHHLWAERYDRELKEIFALQDDITKEVMTALQVKLTTGEQARVYGKGTDKLEAYLKLLQGREHYRRGTKEDNILARRIFEEVIALDPKYAIAYRFLSGTHHADLAFGTSKSPKQSIARAIELAKRAIAIDDSLAEAHGFLGFLYTLTGQYEKGIEEAERAVALDPNSADAHIHLGAVLHNAGRREEAIPIIKRAIRLNPIAPALYFVVLGRTYRSLGRYEEAIEACKNAVQRNPDFLFAHVILAATYSLTGKEEQARAAAKEVLRIDPNFSLDSFAKRRKKLIGDNKTEMKLFIDALRKAGLPD